MACIPLSYKTYGTFSWENGDENDDVSSNISAATYARVSTRRSFQIVRKAYASVLLIKMVDENRDLSTSNLTSLLPKWLERFHSTPLHNNMELQVKQRLCQKYDHLLLFELQIMKLLSTFKNSLCHI
jgi:hypothetical protein